MKRFAGFWRVVVVAAGFASPGGLAAVGQTAPVPPPPPPAPMPGEFDQLVHRMSEELRALDGAIANDLASTSRGKRLQDDARELTQAVDEFQGNVRGFTHRSQATRAYSSIDGSWHHLLSQIGQPGSSSTAVDRAAQRVAQTDMMIHRALSLNEYPAGYYGGTQALSGMVELQRLTHALADRAEALASFIRADYPGPAGARLVQEATYLAQAADTYHDALDLNGRLDATAQNGFAGLAGLADRLQADLAQVSTTPRVRNAWKAYNAAEVLVRRTLGLPNAPEDLTDTVLMEMPGGGSPITDQADRLVKQVSAFLDVFGPTAGSVPEGAQFLAEARSLQAAATEFRREAASALPPNQLAFEFRDAYAIWQRLSRRTERIARGRTGPNIQQIALIGQTMAEIHRLLALPGYAPIVGPYP